ncbi:proprotein convertase subtilisin/kexin type 4-like [Branchiostoma lanceolatum]|uniref:proprotein convertase subtilisin/kexin type 4-like n=1 Tax=Branchiostoma lanceolatum TaxID=7740 RepID=UPI0034541190
MEAAVLTLDYQYQRRGHLEGTLTSPMGTTSLVLRHRDLDIVESPPVVDQDFMSVQFWGENPMGTWTFELRNFYPNFTGNGTLNKWTLTLYGTETDPMAGNTLPAAPGTTCVSDCSNASLVLPTTATTLLSSTLLASTVVGAVSGGSALSGARLLGLLVASVYLML